MQNTDIKVPLGFLCKNRNVSPSSGELVIHSSLPLHRHFPFEAYEIFGLKWLKTIAIDVLNSLSWATVQVFTIQSAEVRRNTVQWTWQQRNC
jgi:hypothetical protein